MRLAVVMLVAAGCAATPPPRPCSTGRECRAYENERVELVGTYTVFVRGKSPERMRRVHIVPAGAAGGPFLERPQDSRHKRPPDEIERFRGKRVRVVGRYHAMIPQSPEPVQQLAGSYLENVETIELAE